MSACNNSLCPTLYLCGLTMTMSTLPVLRSDYHLYAPFALCFLQNRCQIKEWAVCPLFRFYLFDSLLYLSFSFCFLLWVFHPSWFSASRSSHVSFITAVWVLMSSSFNFLLKSPHFLKGKRNAYRGKSVLFPLSKSLFLPFVQRRLLHFHWFRESWNC